MTDERKRFIVEQLGVLDRMIPLVSGEERDALIYQKTALNKELRGDNPFTLRIVK